VGQGHAAKLREALMEGIDAAPRRNRRDRRQSRAAPTFANTSVAMQMSGEPLDRAMAMSTAS
jgi:hypothetical protein